MNNLNNFVEALVSISEVRNLKDASGEETKAYVKNVTESLDEQSLKFINPFILNYSDTFVIRNRESISYQSIIHNGLILATNPEYRDKITLSIIDDKDFHDLLLANESFVTIYKLTDLKEAKRATNILYTVNGVNMYFSNRLLIFGVDSDTQPDFLDTLLKLFKEVLTVLAFKHPEIVTRELIEGISRELPELKEVERDLKLGIIKNLVKNFGVTDTVNEFKRLTRTAIVVRESIKNLNNRIFETESILNEKKDELKYIQERLSELGPDIYNSEENNDETLQNLILDLGSHFLIDGIRQIRQSGDTIEVSFLSKPIKVLKFDMSPDRVINNRIGHNELTDYVGQAYMDAYENKDNPEQDSWEAYFSPVVISFNIHKHNRNESGIKINNLYVSPLRGAYYNPHNNMSCYGTYENVLEDALDAGNAVRVLNILNEYLGSVTLGDVGASYLNSSKLTRKGEKIQWDESNNETVKRYLQEVEIQEIPF